MQFFKIQPTAAAPHHKCMLLTQCAVIHFKIQIIARLILTLYLTPNYSFIRNTLECMFQKSKCKIHLTQILVSSIRMWFSWNLFPFRGNSEWLLFLLKGDNSHCRWIFFEGYVWKVQIHIKVFFPFFVIVHRCFPTFLFAFTWLHLLIFSD